MRRLQGRLYDELIDPIHLQPFQITQHICGSHSSSPNDQFRFDNAAICEPYLMLSHTGHFGANMHPHTQALQQLLRRSGDTLWQAR